MNPYVKRQYQNYLVDYLNTLTDTEVKNDKKEFKCPICKIEQAFLYPNNKTHFYCNNPECNYKGDIFDLIKTIKNSNFSDEDVADYLTHKFKIEVKDDVEDLFKLYKKNNWSLFPLEPNSKIPQKGFKWADKEYRDSNIWREWTDRGYGLAVRLGKVSQIVAIDIDSDETYEKIKHLLPEDTLIQDTLRGRHWVFVYEEDFENIKHINFRNKGYDMELRGNNAYIAIAPTSAEGEIRKWNNKKIQKMPKELKEFIFDLIDTNTKSVEDDIQEAIDKEKIDVIDLSGQRNDTFVKTLGVFSKWMPKETAYKVMNFLSNNWIDKPIPKKELNAMMRQIQKYRTYDKEELANEVLERLKIIKTATAFQIAGSLKREQKDIEDVLKHLEDENKVINTSGRKYQVLKQAEWVTDSSDISVPIDFCIPYFHPYARFNFGGMLLIGSPTGHGKSHITGNFIKQLWEQKRQVHLIDTEPDSNIAKILHNLNVPDEAYLVPKDNFSHPTELELVDDAITIIDWLRMKDGDFSKTEDTFEHFSRQLRIHKGFLIILAQIRTKNNEWFAPDLIGNYASFMVKYLWGNGGVDSENTYFLTNKIRDSKTGQQIITIPTFYNHDTKIIELRK